jgi:large subunit ribosomal protein L25
MERTKLQVRVRDGRGTKDAKALRASGDIPGVIYSATSETQAIAINARDLRHAVTAHGIHSILDVAVDEQPTRPVLIKEFQLDPVRDRVIHVDLHESGSTRRSTPRSRSTSKATPRASTWAAR